MDWQTIFGFTGMKGDSMTLDEAITHLEEKLSEDNFGCVECKNEHEQLLSWLLELKELRKRLPPVSLGDAVYRQYWDGSIKEGRVSMLQQKADGAWKFRVTEKDETHGGSDCHDVLASELGRSVFTTYEDAKKNLLG